MGCVPSMRVAHTDVKQDSTGIGRSAQICPRCIKPTSSETEMESYSNSIHAQGNAKDANKSTYLSEDLKGHQKVDEISSRQNGGRPGYSGWDNEIYLGPLKILRSPMSILLLFPKKDSQLDAFFRAAEMAKYTCHVAQAPDGALQLYNEHHHNVIIIDSRVKKGFDAEGFCRQIRAVQNSKYTVLVAVRPATAFDKEDQSLLSLLKAGFNRQFIENLNAGACLSELQCLEFNDVVIQSKLKAVESLITAIEHSSDAVDITNENHEIQYVNSMFEKMFGYASEEVIGKNFQDISVSDVTDTVEAINEHLNTGKSWHGMYQIRRKNGESLTQKCHIYPVFGQSGKVYQFVGIRNAAIDGINNFDQTLGRISTTPDIYPKRIRRESGSKIPVISIEAPINKAINMISSLQQTCADPVVEALDKVLEVLRSNELYMPYLTQQVRDDKMTSEFVGGLMKIDDDLWNQKRASTTKRLSCTSDAILLSKTHSYMSGLSSMSSEVQALLDSEVKWDFDIIKLEKLTEKRPLLNLAMRTFQRYEVPQFLQVSNEQVYAWLLMIESHYHSKNPYHNSTHAADVMHATSYFLTSEIIKKTFDHSDEVCCLLAAVVHDLNHPGKTNSYLINSNAELAILYNDLAVLESHHVSLAFTLTLKNEKINIFSKLSRDDYRSLRQQVVDMVLATEMTRHFEHLNRFVSVIDQPQNDENDDMSANDKLIAAADRLSTSENRTLIKRMLIKCADISNPARPLKLCMEWAKRIAKEYCQQTDDEKAQGLPVVMPHFDRKTCNVPKSQIGFMDLFIHDMFELWGNFCNMPEMMHYIKENYDYWKTREGFDSEKLLACE